jgi:hypothetical protein
VAKKKKKSRVSTRNDPDIAAMPPWKVGQIAHFRPKLYGYTIWQTGKIWDFAHDRDGNGVAFMAPCGAGWGPVTAAGSTWCIGVDYLHKKEIKTEDKRAKKTELYTTRRNKRRKKKK